MTFCFILVKMGQGVIACSSKKICVDSGVLHVLMLFSMAGSCWYAVGNPFHSKGIGYPTFSESKSNVCGKSWCSS